MKNNFIEDLQRLINSYSKENGSNTPDFILAEYLAAILAAFDEIMRRRDKWYKQENKSNDSFQWTDELVKELVYDNFGGIINKAQIADDIKEFKKSHTPKPQAENRIKTFPEAMAEADKINPRPRYKIPQAENKPDWEIVAFLDNYDEKYIYRKREDGFYSTDSNRLNTLPEHYFSQQHHKIHSVKRLSDGEVFSVGDKVVNSSATNLPHEGYAITHFTVIGERVQIAVPGGFFWLDGIEKAEKYSAPQPQKEEQRIEVRSIRVRKNYCEFFTTSDFTEKELPAIKQAIEQVLNDDTIGEKFKKAWEAFTIKYPEIKDKQIRDAVELLVNNGYVVEHQDKFDRGKITWKHPFFTQQQVDAMCEDVWYAARAKGRVRDIEVYKYEDFEHYKSKHGKK